MNPDLCAAADNPGLVARMLADTDCQAFGLVERGYAALSAPGSATATLITAMMVIAVAFFGYRLMLGRGFVFADLTRLVVRIGVVLLLAASWSTVQGVVYDTVARAPTRVAADLITSIDAPPPLVGIQESLDKIEQASIGWRQRAGIASPLVGGPPTTAMTLNLSAFLLTLTTLGLLVVSRIVLALLLALTPLVAGFLLFDATRGLLEGWLRALIAAALVPLGVLVLGAIEVALVIPILDRMLAEQAGGQFLENSVTPLGLVTIVFSMAIFAALGVLRSIARGIRLTPAPSLAPRATMPDEVAVARQREASTGAERDAFAPAQPRVVRALASLERRDTRGGSHGIGGPAAAGRGDSGAALPSARPAPAQPGRVEAMGFAASPPLRRPLRNRASRAARRRDI